jgi:hypothetical protein
VSWRPYFEVVGGAVVITAFAVGVALLCEAVENAYGIAAGFALMAAVLLGASAVGYWLVNRP